MRVKCTKYEYIYKGKDIEHDLPIMETNPIGVFEGEVIDTVVLPSPDFFGRNKAATHFVVLLELLPKRIEIVDNVYELSVYLYGLYYWNINNGNLCFEAKDNDNLVDACYEAIVFLYEQKLL